MKQLLLITDAWEPQVNGVVRTLRTTTEKLYDFGIATTIIHPGLYRSFALPVYREIRIPYGFAEELKRLIVQGEWDYIHISVEGALGWAAKRICDRLGLKYTTTYHTKFPEYVNERFFIPTSWTYSYVRRFHRSSSKVMVATKSLEAELRSNGFENEFGIWSRGVDTDLFSFNEKPNNIAPYALYVGRVSDEKNIEAFLQTNLGHLTKIVVGDGPQREKLERKYKNVLFAGKHSGAQLATFYRNASVFVFPSLTDTFGLVMIEALACGTPVAAFDVDNVKEIITPEVGCYSDDLETAVWSAMKCDRRACRDHVIKNYTWSTATQQFVSNLISVF